MDREDLLRLSDEVGIHGPEKVAESTHLTANELTAAIRYHHAESPIIPGAWHALQDLVTAIAERDGTALENALGSQQEEGTITFNVASAEVLRIDADGTILRGGERRIATDAEVYNALKEMAEQCRNR